MAPSSFASVEVHLNSRPIGGEWYAEDASFTGPARIAITYGQPHARGRKIVGGLIPNDTVWRFGANAATALHTDLDISIGSLNVPRGDYTLFLVHAGTAWDLIVNSQTSMWGTDRNASKDIGRVRMTARTLTDSEDALSVYLIPDSTNPAAGGKPQRRAPHQVGNGRALGTVEGQDVTMRRDRSARVIVAHRDAGRPCGIHAGGVRVAARSDLGRRHDDRSGGAGVRVGIRQGMMKRHHAVVRITHWVNVVALTIMVGSGLRIFDAYPAFARRGETFCCYPFAHDQIPASLTFGGWLAARATGTSR